MLAPRLSVVVSNSAVAPVALASESEMLAAIAGQLLDGELDIAAFHKLASSLDWTEDRLRRGFQEWSEDERERFRARLVVDDASVLAWWLVTTRGVPRSRTPSSSICDESGWDGIRYGRAVQALLGELPPVVIGLPPGPVDPGALAGVVRLVEGVPGWPWTIICRDEQLREWVFSWPDSHCKAVLRAAWLVGNGEAAIGVSVDSVDPVDSLTLSTGGELSDERLLQEDLGSARSALAKVVDEVSGEAVPGVNATAVERARSLAELALFRMLESLRETRGLFALNVRMGFRFGRAPAELDLFSERLGLCVEVDGPHHFVDADAYRRDRRKDALVQRHGLWMVRVLAEDVVHRLDDVRDHVLTAVRARRAETQEGDEHG